MSMGGRDRTTQRSEANGEASSQFDPGGHPEKGLQEEQSRLALSPNGQPRKPGAIDDSAAVEFTW